MAKIKIRRISEKLDDIAGFLKNNNIDFSIVDDLIDRPSIDVKKYRNR